MNENLTETLSQTFAQYRSFNDDRKAFYDLTLSVITWKILSDFSFAQNSHSFRDICCNHDLDLNTKVATALMFWEEKLNEQRSISGNSLSGLLSLDHSVGEGLSSSIWSTILWRWECYFVHADSDNFTGLFDHIEQEMAIQTREASFLTPQALTRVMVHYIEDAESTNLYDPFPRYGGLLAAAAAHIPSIKQVQGQAATKLSWKLATLRLILCKKYISVAIAQNVRTPRPDEQLLFDTIIANPPYGGIQDGFALPYPVSEN